MILASQEPVPFLWASKNIGGQINPKLTVGCLFDIYTCLFDQLQVMLLSKT